MVYSEWHRWETASLTSIHWVAVLLTLLTGPIHIYVRVRRGQPSLILAGIGFAIGIALFLADYHRDTHYLLGVGYIAFQIGLWVVFQQGEYTLIGVVDKTIQGSSS